MKRKILAAMLSVAVGVAVLGTTCFAAPGGELTKDTTDADMKIEGDSTVKSPIYKVVVPTDIAFGIDAFEQAGQTNSQISSADMYIYNKSNVAVRVQANIKLTPKDNTVTLVDAANKVTETDASKKLYVGVEVPKTVLLTLDTAADATGDDATAVAAYTKHSDGKLYLTAGLTADEKTGGDFDGEGAAAATDIQSQAIKSSAITYAAGTTADPQYIVTLGTDETSLAFALNKADYYKVYNKSSDATGEDKFYKAADGTDGGTAFRLTGTVNSRAPWAAQDIKAEITYSFLGIRNANYATQTADTATDNPNIAYVNNTAKLLNEATGPKFTADDTTLGRINYTLGEGNDALQEITGITWEYEGSQVSVLGNNVILDASAKTLQVSSGGMEYWAAQASTKEAIVTYKTVGNATKTATVTFKLSND